VTESAAHVDYDLLDDGPSTDELETRVRELIRDGTWQIGERLAANRIAKRVARSVTLVRGVLNRIARDGQLRSGGQGSAYVVQRRVPSHSKARALSEVLAAGGHRIRWRWLPGESDLDRLDKSIVHAKLRRVLVRPGRSLGVAPARVLSETTPVVHFRRARGLARPGNARRIAFFCIENVYLLDVREAAVALLTRAADPSNKTRGPRSLLRLLESQGYSALEVSPIDVEMATLSDETLGAWRAVHAGRSTPHERDHHLVTTRSLWSGQVPKAVLRTYFVPGSVRLTLSGFSYTSVAGHELREEVS
jgi:hypothetical protein